MKNEVNQKEAIRTVVESHRDFNYSDNYYGDQVCRGKNKRTQVLCLLGIMEQRSEKLVFKFPLRSMSKPSYRQ